MHFMRKIPKDSEAASMMVGTIDSLTNFYMAFVRLQKSGMIGQLTEVSLPTKFLFILLSPSGYRNEIQEIGRSISTMMIDEVSIIFIDWFMVADVLLSTVTEYFELALLLYHRIDLEVYNSWKFNANYHLIILWRTSPH